MQTPMPTIAPIEARVIQTIPLELPEEQTQWLSSFVQMLRDALNGMSAHYCFANRVLLIFGSGLLLMLLFVPGLIVALLVKMIPAVMHKTGAHYVRRIAVQPRVQLAEGPAAAWCGSQRT